MSTKRMFSIRYKFLVALLGILLSSLSVFFYFAYRTFSQDKMLFVTDLNLTVMKSVTNEIKADFQRRIYEIQSLIPILHEQFLLGKKSKLSYISPFQMLSEDLRNEMLALTFYRQNQKREWTRYKEFTNYPALAMNQLPAYLLYEINSRNPIRADVLEHDQQIGWLNRSLRVERNDMSKDVGILTIVLKARMVGGLSGNFLVAVDLNQEFLRKKLQESDIAEMFLIKSDGSLISHRKIETILEYVSRTFPHPVLPKLRVNENLHRESLQLRINDEDYVVSFGQTGFHDLFVVSQVSRKAAFGALELLIKRFIFLALFIICLAILVTVLLAGRLTANIQKVKSATEKIGSGDMDVALDIKTNDEIQSVSESIQWMAKRITVLLKESAERARMKGELETAQLVQSTLLTSPHILSDKVEVESFYSPATECGGDFFDASLAENKLTVLIGDATGHGASAALLTAVAKSYSSTLDLLMKSRIGSDALSLEDTMSLLNSVICRSCGGQLLMTMSLIELNIDTGEVQVCNAGHESPIRLVNDIDANEQHERRTKSVKKLCKDLFARGERLGFDPRSRYESVSYQLKEGDIFLLYTDGITEAVDPQGKFWGERKLKKTFIEFRESPVSEIKLGLSEAITQHRNTAEQADDITFVLVKWKGAGSLGQEEYPLTDMDSNGMQTETIPEESPAASHEETPELIAVEDNASLNPTQEEEQEEPPVEEVSQLHLAEEEPPVVEEKSQVTEVDSEDILPLTMEKPQEDVVEEEIRSSLEELVSIEQEPQDESEQTESSDNTEEEDLPEDESLEKIA